MPRGRAAVVFDDELRWVEKRPQERPRLVQMPSVQGRGGVDRAGPRAQCMLPRPDALKLADLAEITDEPKSEIVARIVHDFLEGVDLDQLRARRGQEVLIA